MAVCTRFTRSPFVIPLEDIQNLLKPSNPSKALQIFHKIQATRFLNNLSLIVYILLDSVYIACWPLPHPTE